MLSATQLLYACLGSPPVAGLSKVESSCWVCGAPLSEGVHWRDWSGTNFVGQNRVRAPASEHVCPACVYTCSRTSPVPGRPAKDGKKFGGNFRNYSHLYNAGTYFNASKAEKPAVLQFLQQTHAGPWFAAITDSGQKHVLPWASVNPPGTRRGRVLFDEQEVALPIPQGAGWAIVDGITGLLQAGATKAEVAAGD